MGVGLTSTINTELEKGIPEDKRNYYELYEAKNGTYF